MIGRKPTNSVIFALSYCPGRIPRADPVNRDVLEQPYYISKVPHHPRPNGRSSLMSSFSPGKRQREAELARKKQAKAEERASRRARGPKELPIAEASEMFGELPSIEDAMRAIENPGSVERIASSIPVRLFVGNLADAVTDSDLRTAFSAFGNVSDTVVMLDRYTGSPRGFGFVTMSSNKDAPKAIEGLNGSEIKGRNIVVNVATER
jgi:RNA recognition motif-containing protein